MRRALPILVLSLHPGLQAQAPGRSIPELKAFYAASCAKCHGPDGSGRAADGKPLNGMDFTDGKTMAKHSDARMVKAIRKGIFFGVVMHPFKTRITEPEALLLVQEVLRKAQKGKVIAASE
jgi:mono/diheme cytochrome c family protein